MEKQRHTTRGVFVIFLPLRRFSPAARRFLDLFPPFDRSRREGTVSSWVLFQREDRRAAKGAKNGTRRDALILVTPFTMDGEEPSGILPLSSNEQLLTYDIHNIHIVRVLLYIMGHLNNERDRSDDGESRTGGGCNRRARNP